MGMKWMSVETAPDDESIVLVFDGWFVDIGTSVEKGSDTYYLFTARKDRTVTHWMPLPEPPEER